MLSPQLGAAPCEAPSQCTVATVRAASARAPAPTASTPCVVLLKGPIHCSCAPLSRVASPARGAAPRFCRVTPRASPAHTPTSAPTRSTHLTEHAGDSSTLPSLCSPRYKCCGALPPPCCPVPMAAVVERKLVAATPTTPASTVMAPSLPRHSWFQRAVLTAVPFACASSSACIAEVRAGARRGAHRTTSHAPPPTVFRRP